MLKKDLNKVNDNIIIAQLANSTITQKLSHLNVQIFNNFADLLNLYGGELYSDIPSMLKFGNCKFYLVEIYITKSMMEKVKELKCMLHVTVRNGNRNINKTVMLRNKIPIREIIPVESNIINSTVEASLLVPSEVNLMVIRLDTVNIDISYHFQVYREKQKSECKIRNILQITESYNKGVINQDLQKLETLERKLFCDVEKDYFISTLLKNCYHQLDLELFLELKNDADKDFILKLSNGREAFNLIFNRREKYLKLEADMHSLCLLRKYFSKEFYQNTQLNTDVTSDILKTLKV